MEKEIKEMYLKGCNKKEIIEKYKLTYQKLNYILNKMNILKIKNYKNKIKLNENFFDKIDTESKAYFLGLLSSDGYLSGDGKTIGISLKREDKYILESFKKEIEFEGEVKNYVSKTKFGTIEYSRIKFNSNKIYGKLEEFGFTNKKSFSFKPKIELIEKSFLKDFLRGYFDGNCSIIKRKTKTNKIYFQVSILGLKNIIEIFKSFFNIEYNYFFDKRKETSDVLSIKIQKKDLVYKILNTLYENSNFKLERKYQRYIEFKQSSIHDDKMCGV